MLIHVGYHKTGTTLLQRFVFPARAGFGFARPWPDRSRLADVFVRPSPLAYRPEPAAELVRTGMASAGDAVPVLTHERLSGNPHAGGYDASTLARRIRRATDGLSPRILIVVREQRSMVRSLYSQYVRAGGAMTLAAYLAPHEDVRLPGFDPVYLEYDRLIARYRQLFGPQAVLVLPYEWLRMDPVDFVGRIRVHCGRPPLPEDTSIDAPRVNTRMTVPGIFVKRQLNRLFVRDSLNPAPLVPGLVSHGTVRRLAGLVDRLSPGGWKRLDASIHRWVGDRYDAPNRRLEKITGLDLGALGYRV